MEQKNLLKGKKKRIIEIIYFKMTLGKRREYKMRKKRMNYGIGNNKKRTMRVRNKKIRRKELMIKDNYSNNSSINKNMYPKDKGSRLNKSKNKETSRKEEVEKLVSKIILMMKLIIIQGEMKEGIIIGAIIIIEGEATARVMETIVEVIEAMVEAMGAIVEAMEDKIEVMEGIIEMTRVTIMIVEEEVMDVVDEEVEETKELEEDIEMTFKEKNMTEIIITQKVILWRDMT